jgi:hypothetical protein
LFQKTNGNYKTFAYGTLDAFTLWWLGRMEKGIDWSGNMSNHFWMLVLLKVVTSLFLYLKTIPLGVQIVVVEKNNLIHNHKPIKITHKLMTPTTFFVTV